MSLRWACTGPILSSRQYFLHTSGTRGKKSGGTRQVGWEAEADVISKECTPNLQKDVLFPGSEAGKPQTLMLLDLPGTQGFCRLYLSARETPAFHTISNGSRGGSRGTWNTLPNSDFPCWARQQGTFAITDGWDLKEKSTPFPSTQWSHPWSHTQHI